jgi:FAD-dependent sensor of blue light
VKRITYCSQASYDFAPEELIALLKQARPNNDRAGVSGMLLYGGQSFLQLLEGDAKTLEATYSKVLADDRHTNLRLLAETDVAAPLFPDWTTGFKHLEDEELAQHVQGFTAATEYPLVNPDLITNAGIAQTPLQLYARNRIQ